MHETAQPAQGAGGGGHDAGDLAVEARQLSFAFGGAGDPVDRILEGGRDRRVVLGAGDEQAVVFQEELLERESGGGQAVACLEILVIDGQGVIAEADDGDLGPGGASSGGRDIDERVIEGGVTQAASEGEDPRGGAHGRAPVGRSVGIRDTSDGIVCAFSEMTAYPGAPRRTLPFMLPHMTIASSSIRLSDRAEHIKPSATLAVSARVKQLRAEGRDIIGFGAGEPDFDTPDVIRAVAVQALQAGRTHYEAVPGPLDVREAIAAKLARENGIKADPDHILLSCGAKHSVYLAIQALVNPGDEVIILTPAWVSYRPMIELAGGTVVEVGAGAEQDFRVAPDQLADAITERTRVILLNSPSNPTGSMYTPDELRAFADIVAGHEQIVVISDEIYERLVFGGVEHFSIGSLEAIADRVITVNGMSKAFAMTGWRIGYAYAPGLGGGLAKAMAKLQGQMTTHITSFVYPAVIAALTQADPDVERMRQIFAQRATLIHGLITAMPGVQCPMPHGAFYVFPDIRAYLNRTSPGGRSLTTAVDFAQALLDEAGVGVVPGEDFGAIAATHIRLSFAASEDQIKEGCRRLHEWLVSFS